MKKGLQRFYDRVRGRGESTWSKFAPDTDRAAELPPAENTGWTVHRDVSLRHREVGLKNLSVEEGSMQAALVQSADTGEFKIRLAGKSDYRRDAEELVEKRYSRRGYRTSAKLVNANICTFSAYDEGRLAGTVSLRLDSKMGLAADELYHAELESLRRQGRKLCEFTRLAVDTTQLSQAVLAGLFHTVFLFAQELRDFNFVVIEVNPRHVGFYRRVLGFGIIGEERHNTRVDAPAVLMGVSFRDIGENLHRHAGKGKQAETQRNLYTYGFSPAEEAGILGRLRSIDRR